MLEVITLFSGSSGNSTLVRADGTELLIDAGVSCRRLCAALQAQGTPPTSLRHVLLTHGHSDHTAGLRVLRQRLPGLELRSTAETAAEAGVESTVFRPGESFELGRVRVRAFETPHDAAGSVGFVIECESGTLGYATDVGHVTPEVERALTDCTLVVLESNYDLRLLRDGSYPWPLKRRIESDRGHLDNTCCASLAARLASAGTRSLVLAHLSRENNRPLLAYEATARGLRACGATPADVYLQTAPPEGGCLMRCGK